MVDATDVALRLSFGLAQQKSGRLLCSSWLFLQEVGCFSGDLG